MTIPHAPLTKSQRLASLDALRGFDMFLIAGAENMVRGLAEYTDWGFLKSVESEFHHPDWNGFTFFDLIFPLFMFLAGVSFAFSFARRVEEGESLRALQIHVITRACLLILLGAICNGLLSLEFDRIIYCSVLGRIGLGCMCGALLAMHVRSQKGRLICCAVILFGYWAAMMLVPVPGYGAGDLTPGHTLAGYIDRMLMPGRLYAVDRDPNGLLATIPAVVNVLAGIMTGDLIRRTDRNEYQKVGIMFVAGIVSWTIGRVWDAQFPINKNLWSSSFVMVTIGWSLMFLALFYLLIDVLNIRSWAFVFVVIGMNPLLIYVAQQFIAFRDIAHLLLHDEQDKLHPLFIEVIMFSMKWSLLYWLYRRRIFWRV